MFCEGSPWIPNCSTNPGRHRNMAIPVERRSGRKEGAEVGGKKKESSLQWKEVKKQTKLMCTTCRDLSMQYIIVQIEPKRVTHIGLGARGRIMRREVLPDLLSNYSVHIPNVSQIYFTNMATSTMTRTRRAWELGTSRIHVTVESRNEQYPVLVRHCTWCKGSSS